MSKDRDARASSPWSSYSQQFQNPGASQTHLTVSTEANNQGRALFSAPPTSSSSVPTRFDLPVRSSTDPSRAYSSNNPISVSRSRSEDLNHHGSSSNSNADILSSSPRPLAHLHSSAATSRPSTPGTSKQSRASSSSHSDHTPNSESSKLPSNSTSTAASIAYRYVFFYLITFLRNIRISFFVTSSSCSACGKAMQGPFVRALGSVFHLNCFKCMVGPFFSHVFFSPHLISRIVVKWLPPSSFPSMVPTASRILYANEIISAG